MKTRMRDGEYVWAKEDSKACKTRIKIEQE